MMTDSRDAIIQRFHPAHSCLLDSTPDGKDVGSAVDSEERRARDDPISSSFSADALRGVDGGSPVARINGRRVGKPRKVLNLRAG